MKKDYQQGYSELHPDATYDADNRKRKAETMIRVLGDHFGENELNKLMVLDVGASTGFIDDHLSRSFNSVIGIDIDEKAIKYAKNNFKNKKLHFCIGDAMSLKFDDEAFDVVICSHVYEHVPDSDVMMREIYRVLKSDGVCYLSAGNRLNIIEPHHHLPFLSVMPKFMAHVYMRIAGKGTFYYETHRSYWGLRKLVAKFEVIDYTKKIIGHPERFGIEYMIKPGSKQQSVAKFIASYTYWLMPGYVWLLKKPAS